MKDKTVEYVVCVFENDDIHTIASDLKIFQVTRLILLNEPTVCCIRMNTNYKTEE